MPRSSSRSSGARRSSSSGMHSPSSFGRSTPPPKHSSPAAAPPAVQKSNSTPMHPPAAPPPAAAAPQSGGFMSNMAGNMASGVASGVGFGVAQRALDSFMGPRKMEVVHTENGQAETGGAASPLPAASSPCAGQQEDLTQCLKRHSDASLCQNYVESLKTCEANIRTA